MILVDMSGILHRMIHGAIRDVQPKEKDGMYITSEYSDLMIDYFMRDLIKIQNTYKHEYGEMILLFDDWKKDYWRKDVYPAYKDSRGKLRAKSKVNFKEIYEIYNTFSNQLEENTPWRCVTVNRAEADDTILVLSREYCQKEKILIYSADKDFIQSQRWTNNVFQYSALTKKWIVPGNKHESMEHWLLEHVMLGDESDGVPKVVQHCEFSDNFVKHLKECNIKECTVQDFKCNITEKHKEALASYDVQKKNRAGVDIGLDVYKDVRFGPSTLKKAINEHGSLDSFLDSHPLYREHYNRNFILVMEEGIPEEIWQETLFNLDKAKTDYNVKEFEEYLTQHNLHAVIDILPTVFKRDTISVENCGW